MALNNTVQLKILKCSEDHLQEVVVQGGFSTQITKQRYRMTHGLSFYNILLLQKSLKLNPMPQKLSSLQTLCYPKVFNSQSNSSQVYTARHHKQ